VVVLSGSDLGRSRRRGGCPVHDPSARFSAPHLPARAPVAAGRDL